MKTSQEDVREIMEMAASAARGNLPVSTVAFRAATCIVENRDVHLMEQLPMPAREWLQGMISVFKEEGHVISLYSVGEVDHTDLVRRLVEVIEGSDAG